MQGCQGRGVTGDEARLFGSGGLQLSDGAPSRTAHHAVLRSLVGAEPATHDAIFGARDAAALRPDDDQCPCFGDGHDRTTLGRNIWPLERDGLIAVEQGSRDRRSKERRLTAAGEARFRIGMKGWLKAQHRFEGAFGAGRTKEMRALLHAVTATDLATAQSAPRNNQKRAHRLLESEIAQRRVPPFSDGPRDNARRHAGS
jgi:DNA-binding MarR family transcriptional regulator